MKPKKIYCVVVTYNRLELLKENIAAIKNQTYPIEKIIIVNNNSTDGTYEYLKQFDNSPQFSIINLSQNIGGSGGFSTGIKEATLNGSDWIWVMDDDTIPNTAALENLIKHTNLTDNVGFICSKVEWTDSSPHLMNIPNIKPFAQNIPFNQFSDKNIYLIESASFVSLLINTKAVKQVGLPIASFFIWGDDHEFTLRINNHGYLGIYANESIAIHKTPNNYTSDLGTAPDNTAWKFFYEVRNTMYLRRKRRKSYLSFLFSSISHLKKDIKRIKKRKTNQKEFKKAVYKGFRAGLKFNPQIEYIQDKEV